MARIPDEELERLKREVSVVRLVEAAGIALKKHGAADLVGRCPFHEDKTPSLVVTPKKNLWHCLGACQMGGGRTRRDRGRDQARLGPGAPQTRSPARDLDPAGPAAAK